MRLSRRTTVLTPATTYDLVELRDVWIELGITSGDADPYLERQISSASRYVSTQCNRVFVIETVRDDFSVPTYWPSDTCAAYQPSLFLSRWPVQHATTPPDDSVPAIVLTEGGVTLVEDTDFIVDYNTGEVVRLGSNGRAYWPETAISVTYTAGYSEIPADLTDAVMRIIRARYYAQKRDPNLRGQTIPGVYEAQYWVSDKMDGNMMPDVSDLIDSYRAIGSIS